MKDTQNDHQFSASIHAQPQLLSTATAAPTASLPSYTDDDHPEKAQQGLPPLYNCNDSYIRSPPPPYFAPGYHRLYLSGFNHMWPPPSVSVISLTNTDWSSLQKRPRHARIVWYLSSWKPVMRDGRVAFCGCFAFFMLITLVVMMITIVMPRQLHH